MNKFLSIYIIQKTSHDPSRFTIHSLRNAGLYLYYDIYLYNNAQTFIIFDSVIDCIFVFG